MNVNVKISGNIKVWFRHFINTVQIKAKRVLNTIYKKGTARFGTISSFVHWKSNRNHIQI